MDEPGDEGYLRIGELARRTGVTPELLRAWEQRYGLLRPTRSSGGFRLYSDADEARVRRTTALIGQGIAAAEAARRALATGDGGAGPAPQVDAEPLAADLAADLEDALDRFDGEAAHAAVDRLLGALSVEAALERVILPYLRRLGDRWESGEVSVAQEHFASNLLRGRLLGIARGWGAGTGPLALLACPPGEEHELALIAFGIAIWRRGWRVAYLGADTPFATLDDVVRDQRPALVVLAITDAKAVRRHADEIAALAARVPVAVGGSATAAAVTRLGARSLGGDPIAAARKVAAEG